MYSNVRPSGLSPRVLAAKLAVFRICRHICCSLVQFVGSTKRQPNFDCSELHASFEGMSCNNGCLAMSWHAFLPQVFKLPTIGLVLSTFVCLSDFSSILLLKLRYIFVDNTYQKHDLIFLVYGKYYNKKKCPSKSCSSLC